MPLPRENFDHRNPEGSTAKRLLTVPVAGWPPVAIEEPSRQASIGIRQPPPKKAVKLPLANAYQSVKCAEALFPPLARSRIATGKILAESDNFMIAHCRRRERAKSLCAKVTMSRKGDGAWGRIRTTDTRIFNPLLYQLSYPGALRRGARRRL